MQMNYGENSGKDDTLCPVCLEKGEQVAMVRGRATGFYWLCKCPRCGNLRLVERGEEQEKHGDK